MKSVNTFKGVRMRLNTIDNINIGGCAISALAMYRWLEKNNQLLYDTKICFLHKEYDMDSYKNNCAVVKYNEGVLDTCNHAVLYHNGKYYDSNGEYSVKHYNIVQIKDVDKVVDSLNINRYSWNSCFNRSKMIPKIEDLVEVELFDIAS